MTSKYDFGVEIVKEGISEAPQGVTSTVNTEFAIPNPATSGTYVAGDIISRSATTTVPLELEDVVRNNGDGGYIVGARLVTNKKSIIPRIRVHLYNVNNPTLSIDGDPNKELYAEVSKKIGSFDLPALSTPTDSSNSDLSRAVDYTQRIPFKCASTSTSLFYILEAIDAFTPDNGQKFNLFLNIEQN